MPKARIWPTCHCQDGRHGHQYERACSMHGRGLASPPGRPWPHCCHCAERKARIRHGDKVRHVGPACRRRDRLLLAFAAPAIRRWQLQRLARRQQPRTAGDRVCLIRSWRRPGPLCRLLALCAAYDVGVDVSLGCMTNFDVEVAQQLPSLGSSLGILRFTSHVCSTASTHFCQGTETRHGQ